MVQNKHLMLGGRFAKLELSFVLELGWGLGELLSSDVTRLVVSHVPPCLPRRTAPPTGGVPADGTPTLKSVGYRTRVVRIL